MRIIVMISVMSYNFDLIKDYIYALLDLKYNDNNNTSMHICLLKHYTNNSNSNINTNTILQLPNFVTKISKNILTIVESNDVAQMIVNIYSNRNNNHNNNVIIVEWSDNVTFDSNNSDNSNSNSNSNSNNNTNIQKLIHATFPLDIFV